MERIVIPFGFVEDNNVFISSYLGYPSRKIGEVKNSVEETVEYFKNRFQIFETKIVDLEKAINKAENKGSFLMKLLHLKDSIGSYDALGDFIPLSQKLDSLEIYLNEIIHQNRIKNSEIKKELLQEASGFKRPMDWKAATESILDIKSRWLRTGNALEEENDQLEIEFKNTIDGFFERKRNYFEEKKVIIDDRIAEYEMIIESLVSNENLTPQNKINIEEKWKKVGKIPPSKQKELNQRFYRLLKSKATSVSMHRFTNISESELQTNLESKQQIVAAIKELNIESNEEASAILAKLKDEWRNIGMIPKTEYKKLTEEYNLAFGMAQEKIYLHKRAQQSDKNYNSKNSREKARIQLRLLKDLLSKDEKDLQNFYENMNQIQFKNSGSHVSIERQLNLQKQKVQTKRTLMRSIKHSLDSI